MNRKDLKDLLKADLLRLALREDGTHENKPKLINWFSPRFTPVLIIRLARYVYLKPRLRIFSSLLTWLNVFLFGIECTPKCSIGPGLFLPHTVGTVIGASQIGSNATIFQGVTLGSISIDLFFNEELRPIVGNNVVIGSGAKVLGGLSIGNDARIGANSVVLNPVESGSFVVGIPASVYIASKNKK